MGLKQPLKTYSNDIANIKIGKDHRSLLHYAVRKGKGGNLEAIKTLLSMTKNKEQQAKIVNKASKDQCTPLGIAAVKGADASNVPLPARGARRRMPTSAVLPPGVCATPGPWRRASLSLDAKSLWTMTDGDDDFDDMDFVRWRY